MAQNNLNQTRNKHRKGNTASYNASTSATVYNDMSAVPWCQVNEIIDLDDVNETKESCVEQDGMVYDNHSTEEDEDYWDNRIADILQVECTEGPNTMEISDDTTSDLRYKVYPIHKYCALCDKTFSRQRDLIGHAKQAHPGSKAFKCIHCPTIFSKLKSVTAHFNRSHSQNINPKDGPVANRNVNGDSLSNQKGKIYPIEDMCAVCDRTFSFQRDLVKHTKQDHPNEKAFRCLYCPTLFSKVKSVSSHYKRSHSKYKKSIVCEFCNMTFFTQFLLERHRRSHTEHRPFACQLCDKTYKYKRNLLVHMKTHSRGVRLNNTDKEDDCIVDEYCENDEEILITEDEYCESDGDGRESLTEDEEDGINMAEFPPAAQKNIIKVYPFKCNDCDRAYRYQHSLSCHQKTHWQNIETAHEITDTIILDDDASLDGQDNLNFCNNSTYFIIDELKSDSECLEDFGENGFASPNNSDEYYYEDNALDDMKTSANIEQNECFLCKKKFKCQQSVAKHLQISHSDIEFFKCPYCDDNFYSLETLQLHIEIKKHPQKRNVCEICLKSFDRKSDLKRHARTHTDERPYACDICRKTFKQTNHLKRHKELNHENPKMRKHFFCEICMTSFLRKDKFKRHMARHGRGKRYPCSMCHKAFKTRYDWQRHEATHSSRKNMICEFCLTSFENTEAMNLHISGHTGDRKYLCTTCEKTFKEKSHLVNHRKTHESNEKKVV